VQVHLFEAAPKAGGRTRSFYESSVDCWCDNGPHLLLGAYQSSRKLFDDCGVSQHIHWQPSLYLPLWEQQRGAFGFQPSAWLPFQLALLKAVNGLPGHDTSSSISMIKLAATLKSDMHASCTVQQWLSQLSMPDALVRDLIEPLCLGAMNEGMDTACALSFRRVLHDSFASHKQSRLGWFTQPLDSALIQPLCQRAKDLGVQLHLRSRIRTWDEQANGQIHMLGQSFQAVILALPAYATDRLLNRPSSCETRPICNVHLWFEHDIHLPETLIGGIGTTGQWFFNVSAQMDDASQHTNRPQHICAVISANQCSNNDLALVQSIRDELRQITHKPSLNPIHYRIIREKRATVVVRQAPGFPALPQNIIDASERPSPGELPATIELAVQRGENAAARVYAGS